MLSERVVSNTINAAMMKGAEFVEIFAEDKLIGNIKTVGGLVEDSLSGRDYGAGIRIINGLKSIYAYTNDTSEDNMVRLASEAAQSIKEGSPKELAFNKKDAPIYNMVDKLLFSTPRAEKLELLKRAYSSAKGYSNLITQVTSSYMEEEQDILIANSEGLWIIDKRIRTRFAVSSVASLNGEMQQGYNAPGASMGFEFYSINPVEKIAEEASRIAVEMIHGEYSPSGIMPVVIDNGFGGVLFHEACGHALEASFVSKGVSAFGGKLGEMVASPLVTAIDDGTLANGWGTTGIDDEGTPTRRNILIENGVLKSYLVDKLNGKRMGMESTGSARRQSYRFSPTSRMNNTFIANGDMDPMDIISTTEYGLYAKSLGGGSVDPATGDFNFAVMEGYLIKNGRLTRPLRGATIVGNGVKVLELIDAVGNNLALGQGMCGAESGSIPANVGQPMIRVSSLTVGGRNGDK
ncbi:TldD/PmbA family protein [Gudongella oleilytica]|jgi:TldD protein|uniref:TldD/PmbA family protein n=1 Tax=Gudongella oleilytica TaxID=1582259 RepID=UPI000FF893E3|nr:TldD/PmbA family protein [Gudongella oleilytica]MDY0257463.1 TldD/PmbA family protein [Gudongella oleilytica]